MDWITSLQEAIHFMEANLLQPIDANEVARRVYISPLYFQKGFKIMTGYSVSEYIRCRRLYLAALELMENNEKVIDLAYKYGYDTPESFTKAFKRFHGASPVQVRAHAGQIKPFLPLKIRISIQGGNDMDYRIEKMEGFTVIGTATEMAFDAGYATVPGLWDEFVTGYLRPQVSGKAPRDAFAKAICDNGIGEFGICIDDTGKPDIFRYMIAGTYKGGDVPEGMVTFDLPAAEWIKFPCTSETLQSVNTRIFDEWLPNHPEYRLSTGIHAEWYAPEEDLDGYQSEIWIPVTRAEA